jgi:hypothetical protein
LENFDLLKKEKKNIGLVRVAISLCNCLTKKYITEKEGVWV